VGRRKAPVVGGIDGCRAGWVLATVPAHDGGAPEVSVLPDLGAVVADVASCRLLAAGIDVPIGLAAREPRACDREARALLGARRSSVFPAPVRRVLGATGYDEASAISRRVCGRGISKQLFNLLPKLREVDAVQSPDLQAHLFELCPELSFAVLAGAPMRHPKRTAEGRDERVRALRPVFGDLSALVGRPPSGAARDDVLDAIVGAWTARRYVRRAHIQVGGELDETGLRMEVIA
jgi:predicted RNase H-like nuclease